jgi:hypothetical protein
MRVLILAFLFIASAYSQIGPARPPASPAGTVYIPPFTAANNAWNALQSLGKGCCSNCSKICGFAIKVSNTNSYLTDMGTYLQFQATSNPSQSTQIFTLGQNADCTWSISINGRYLSQMNMVFVNNLVGFASTITNYERWYIETAGPDVYIQSAGQSQIYWTTNLNISPRLNWTPSGTKLKMEYYPCDKTYGWNW